MRDVAGCSTVLPCLFGAAVQRRPPDTPNIIIIIIIIAVVVAPGFRLFRVNRAAVAARVLAQASGPWRQRGRDLQPPEER